MCSCGNQSSHEHGDRDFGAVLLCCGSLKCCPHTAIMLRNRQEAGQPVEIIREWLENLPTNA